MPVDFHYDPLTGPLSGPSFVDQTERGFNELGEVIDETADKADEAKSLAEAAQTTANQATVNAENAQTAANDATTTANGAAALAGEAKSESALALSKANQAIDDSSTAVGNASEALGKANQAITDSATAVSDAATAKNTSEQAENLAIAAGSRSSKALGKFTVDETELDLDELYHAADKIYATEEGAHFPSGLEAPIWLEVLVTDDGAGVTQNCWNDTANQQYTRCASVNLSDPESPVVTWTPWNSVAVPEVVKSVEVVVNPSGQPAGTYLVITMETEDGDTPVYINMSDLAGQVYSAGNAAVVISADHKISLKLSATPGGLSITTDGLTHTLSYGSTTTTLAFGETGIVGEATTLARSDHTHSLPDAPSSAPTITRGKKVFTTAAAAGSQVTVGSYKVGSKNLLIFYDNTLCEMGSDEQYTEVGTAGTASTTIAVQFDIPIGGLLTWVVIS
jgi:hypothetical protein